MANEKAHKPQYKRRVYAIRNLTDFILTFIIIIILLSVCAAAQGTETIGFRWILIALFVASLNLRLEVIHDKE